MGYVGEYRPGHYQGEPWHPKLFLEGKIDTLPYEHDSIILYSGISNHEFFTQEHSFDNSKSILDNQLITPTNVFYEDKEVGSYDVFTSKQPATYMGILATSRLFALINEHPETRKTHDRVDSSEGAVLELQVPTKPLWTLMAKKPLKLLKLKRKGNTLDFKPYSNLKELRRGLGVFGNNIENFGDGNIENFRKLIRKASQPVDPSKNGAFSNAQIVHWATQYPVNVDNITGVWDVNFNSREPNFESFEEYVIHQKQKHPDKMPDKSQYYKTRGNSLTNSKVKKRIEEELEDIKRLEILYGELIDNYIDIYRVIEDFHNLSNFRNDKKLKKQVLDDMEAHHKEKNHLYNKDWDIESKNKEIEFEQVVNTELADEVIKIPSLQPAYERIKEEPPGWLRSYIVKKLDLDGHYNSLENPLKRLKKLKKSLN